MKPRMLLFIALACFLLAVIVVVVGVLLLGAGYMRMTRPMTSTVNEMAGEGAGETGQPYRSNGERIYLAGVNEAGERIAFSGGPHWLRMHGGSCADCHGRQGRGGVPIMGSGELAPDIRYSALTGEEEEHGDEGEHEHERYTDADIKRSITRGIEPDGDRLSLIMPRWQMSDRDLDDLIAHLKELDKQ